MSAKRTDLVLAQIAWEKKEATRVNFFHNLLKLQKKTTKKKLELIYNPNSKKKCDNVQVFH